MTRVYKIDYDKVKTLEDIKIILRAIGIRLEFDMNDCPKAFKEIVAAGFLKEEGNNDKTFLN